MQTRKILIINKLGLHARAAAKFVSVSSKFVSEITVVRDQRRVNGKSIMGMMMLAASKGTQIEVSAQGEDESQALEAIENIVNNRFDEAE